MDTEFKGELMKKLLQAVVLAGCLSWAGVGFAQAPSDASLERLAVVLKFDENFTQGMQAGFMESFALSIKSDESFQNLNPEEQQALYALAERFGQKVLDDINTPKLQAIMLDEFKRIAKRYYTEEEVSAMIGFYGSPIGQKIITKEAAMMNEFMGGVSTMLLDPAHPLKQSMDEAIQRHSEEFTQEVELVFGSK